MQCAPVVPPFWTSIHSTVTNWSFMTIARVPFPALSMTTPLPDTP
jgi:hypothetical protein